MAKEGEGNMILQTARLILRPWKLEDAKALYECAKDPKVGPAAGWPVHTSVENSREIIENVLSAKETYAIVLKTENTVVGSIGLQIGETSHEGVAEDEAEIGYWIGSKYWGQGLIPEATREIMRYAFENLEMKKLWCGYYEGNEKSHRVQEKCGFHLHHINENMPCPLMNDTRTTYMNCITYEEWKKRGGVFNRVVQLAKEKGLLIKTMESCTSGAVASAITDIEGASSVLQESYITYCNESKIQHGVAKEIIKQFSVYSKETAKAMAKACLVQGLSADIGIGVTGNFGNIDPDNKLNSTPGKVYFAIAISDTVQSKVLYLPPQESRHTLKACICQCIAETLEKLIMDKFNI